MVTLLRLCLFPSIFSQTSFVFLSRIALRETFHHGRRPEARRRSTVVPLARARYDKRRQMVDIQARRKHPHIFVPRASFFLFFFFCRRNLTRPPVLAPELLLTKTVPGLLDLLRQVPRSDKCHQCIRLRDERRPQSQLSHLGRPFATTGCTRETPC